MGKVQWVNLVKVGKRGERVMGKPGKGYWVKVDGHLQLL